MIKKSITFILLQWVLFPIFAQSIDVLFIGNSYTGVNDLPQLFLSVATSTGDQVTVSSNTPGGSTFQQHCTNQSATYIQQGGWEFVVLQEQSQLPAFPLNQVQTSCFPYAAQLNDLIELHNPCAETVFYMTWGRKYGDQDNAPNYPPIGTYEGMDSLLFERYMYMTEVNDAIVSPVGRVWRYLRNNHPEIELYSSDNSHPSLEGSYAAACSFYTTILRKDPTLITDYCGVTANVAQIIQNVVKTVIYDQQSTWYIGERALNADFEYDSESGFQNLSRHTNSTTTYYWDFGNGDFSTDSNPLYQYQHSGNYPVVLTATDACGQSSIKTKEVSVVLNVEDFIQDFHIFPNPVQNVIQIKNLNNDSDYSITLYDLNGKRVHHESDCNRDKLISVSNFSRGIYLLKIMNQRGIFYKKIVVN